MEDFSHGRAGLSPQFLQVVAGDEGLGLDFLLRKLGEFVLQKGMNIQLAVAGSAIDPVEFEFFGKCRTGEHPFQGADPHVGGVLEGHMVGDTCGDGADVIVGKTEAAENLLRHTGADSLMTEKTDPAVGFGFRGTGLPHIMEKGREGEDRRRIFQVGEQQAGVDPDIAFGVVFGGLGASAHFKKLRNPDGQKSGIMHQIQAEGGIGADENLYQFVPHPFRGDHLRVRSEGNEGFPCGRFDFEAKLHGKAESPEEAKAVFRKTGDGVADRANGFGGEIRATLDIVEDFVFERIKKHSVYGEVPSPGVFFGGGEGHGRRPPPVEVRAVDTERGNFKDMLVHPQADDTERFALRVGGFGKQGLNLVGCGGGGDVDIGIWAFQQGISHATAGVNRDMAGLDQLPHDRFGLGMTDHDYFLGDRNVR